MAKYIDSSDERRNQYIFYWLEANLKENVKAFRTQCGYFRYNAIEPFECVLRNIARSGNALRFVLGANDGDLYAEDLADTLRIVEEGANSKLTVVRFSGAKFHPKCYYIRREDDSEAAIVGSSNLTGSGVSLNVEASIVLDTMDGDPSELLMVISNAIDEWGGKSRMNGAYQVSSQSDVDALVRQKIIDIVSPKVALKGAASQKKNKPIVKLKTRNLLWKKLRRRSRRTTKIDRMATILRPQGNVTSIEVRNVNKRWSKKLRSSDAQQVGTGTNPTGKLRLARAGHDIDFKRWFRNDLFGDAQWSQETRQGKIYEVTEVPFHVKFLDKDFGEQRLTIDNAPHRIAGQNNVPTVLAWGHQLMRELRRHSYIDMYVMIEKYDNGEYGLQILDQQPESPLLT